MDSKTAFVFSGGASLGSIEVGALKALVEHGVQADLVLGTSVGSLNGAMYAYNPTLDGVQVMEKIWRNIKMWNVFTPSLATPLVNLTTSGQYLVSPKNLRNLIIEHMPYTRIEETKIPLYLIGVDIKTGEEIVFNKGLLLEALMSSAGIPGVFPPQHMGVRVVVDGGVLNNAPISTAVRLGAKRIVIFPIGVPSSDQEPKNAMEMLIRGLIYLLNRQLSSDIQFYKRQVELVLIPPPDRIDVGPHDFSKSNVLIDQAYEKAKKWLNNYGYKPNSDLHFNPCNVYTQPINFMEAITPIEITAKERVKESISKTSKDLKESLSEVADEIKKTLDTKAEELKGKLTKKKPEEESKN